MKRLPIYLHINYFERTHDLEQTFALAKDLGVDGVELRDRDRSGKTDLEKYLAETARCSEKRGLPVTYGCRVATTEADPAARQASTKDFLRVIEFAAGLGVKFLNVFSGPLVQSPRNHSENGSAMARPEDYEEAARILGIGAEAAAAHGMDLCLETHNGYIHDLPAPTVRLLDQINAPNVKVNFDYGNIGLHKANEGLAKSIDALAPRTGYIHLKNMSLVGPPETYDWVRMPLPYGDIDHFDFVRRFASHGYQGVYCIENTMPGDRLGVVEQEIEYLRKVFDRVASP